MATPYSTTRRYFTADGIAVEFSFPLLVRTASDLLVWVDSSLQVAGYSISGLGIPGQAVVVFSTPPASGAKICLARVTRIERLNDISVGDPTSATGANARFDRVYEILQDLSTRIDACVQVAPPVAGTLASTTIPSLPPVAGAAVVSDPAGTGVTFSTAAVDAIAANVTSLQTQVSALGPSEATAVDITLVVGVTEYQLPVQVSPNGASLIANIGPIRLVAGVDYTITNVTYGAGRGIQLTNGVSNDRTPGTWPAGERIVGSAAAALDDAAIGTHTIVGDNLADGAVNRSAIFATSVIPASALGTGLDIGSHLAGATLPPTVLISNPHPQGSLLTVGPSGWQAVEAAAGTDGLLWGSNGLGLPTLQGARKLLASPVDFSGTETAHDWNSIPDLVKEIVIDVSGIRLSGSEQLQLLLGTGTSGSPNFAAAGYNGICIVYSSGYISSSSFILIANASSAIPFYGSIRLNRLGSRNAWILNSTLHPSAQAFGNISSGGISLSGALTQLRLKSATSNLLAAGAVSVSAYY